MKCFMKMKKKNENKTIIGAISIDKKKEQSIFLNNTCLSHRTIKISNFFGGQLIIAKQIA